jgi:hypothetical protein
MGEKLIHDFVSACGQNPGLTLNRQGMRAFFRASRRELPTGDPLLTLPSLTSTSALPTLESILRMVTAFGVSLLDFQSPQPPPTNRSLYTPASIGTGTKRRCCLPKKVRDHVGRELKRVVEGPDMPPSFKQFCQRMQVSPGFVAYRFPELCRTYMKRRNGLARARQDAIFQAMFKAVQDGVMDAYVSGRLTQQKQLVRAVAESAGISIVMARQAVANWDHAAKRGRNKARRRKAPTSHSSRH